MLPRMAFFALARLIGMGTSSWPIRERSSEGGFNDVRRYKALVVPWTTPQRDRQNDQWGVGRDHLIGCCVSLCGDPGSHRANVRADDFAAGGRGHRREAALSRVDEIGRASCRE